MSTILRVASYNIHGGRPARRRANLRAVARVLSELRVDFAGLQEVHRYMPPPGVFQHQPRLLGQWTAMRVCFRASFGVGRSGYGNALLSRERLVQSAAVHLRGGRETRSILEGRCLVDGRTIRIVTTHLDSDPAARLRHARRLADRLHAQDLPTVLAADLNAAPGSAELEALLEAGLLHAVDPLLPTFPSEAPSARIDHILVSRHFEVVSGATVPSTASDHLALVAELVLR